ncbi:MAG: hypothetical protein HQM13_10345 [SAR324 cluster bacterium]|nr:hypothetical protein [SAR324 cluster bacterium]
MLGKFKNLLSQAKPAPPPVETTPVANEPPAPERHPQYSQQWDRLVELFQTLKANPWNESVEKFLKEFLDSLQKYTISDYLASSYNKEALDKFKEYALKEFESMGTINRARVQSLVDLADEEMHKTIFECLFLCDINPVGHPPFELSDTQGFDAKGNPILEKHVYPVFTENALTGVAGIDRFLPGEMIGGNSEKNIQGMKSFLQSEYSEIAAQSGTHSQPFIHAMTTIGSLGGIGHKPDSDMDLQVIFNTSPQFEHRWNDADFFLSLWTLLLHNLQHNFLEKILPQEKRSALKKKVVVDLKARFGEELNEEERGIITEIFPSTYQKALEAEVWKVFNGLKPQDQSQILYRQVVQDLSKLPFMEKYFSQLKKCFPLLRSIDSEKLFNNCFPFSTQKLDNDKIMGWLAKYYKDQKLGNKGAQLIIQKHAKKKGISATEINEKIKATALLEHLAQLKQRIPIIKASLIFTSESISLEQKDSLQRILDHICSKFDPQRQHFDDSNKAKLLEELHLSLNRSFRSRMVTLIDRFSDLEAARIEAASEVALHHKIQNIEKYLTRKYPNTEVHLFTNILRNQRQGLHTPFLVSPEGSMAYSLMLNDFLLNPAVVLAGSSPMPFDLPEDLKVMLSTGILSPSEWSISQSKEGGSESFNFQKLSNWGSTSIPREKLWSHAIPIYLRESEKVSHRNLPKALLNCWWLEMLCCMEKQLKPTSLTQLLWYPENRYFVKYKLEEQESHKIWVEKIKKMEKAYPELMRDPWWLKFTEMLIRFEDSKIRKQIIFCFAQHVRLTDIINFNNECKAVLLDNKATWRSKSLVTFYDEFFPNQDERIDLMKFSQGHDDIGNRMENELKASFQASMDRTKQKLLEIGNEKALIKIVKYLARIGGNTFLTDSIKSEVRENLKVINSDILIADENILQKARAKQELNAMEEEQLFDLKQDRRNIRQIVEGMISQYQELEGKTSVPEIEKYILDSRIKLAGDPLENVIFNYHYKRNFKNKPFQVPLPISKSLSIPRKKIMLIFDPVEDNWIFKSILSKQDSRGGRGESEMEMFGASLVDGLARCVFSGYVGFTTKNLTSFEKPASQQKSPVASNSITHQDIQDLAFAIHDFFQPQRVSPQELLENIHYITDIFMVCNVNRFGIISLIVRDNFGDHYVVKYDVDKIKVKIPSQHMITHDEKFPQFFLRLHCSKGRDLFKTAIEQLKIVLDGKYRPRFKVWVNFGDFDLTISPKFYRIYVNGIAEGLWPADSIGTPRQSISGKLSETLDKMGQNAIKRYQKIEAERKNLLEKTKQKSNLQARAYMDRKRSEMGI